MTLNDYKEDLAKLGCSDKGHVEQLATLFAYNKYYDADPNLIDDVKEGIIYDYQSCCDGAFFNDREAENYIDIITVCTPDAAGFGFANIMNRVNGVAKEIKEAKARQFVNPNPKGKEYIANLYDDYTGDDAKVIFRIVAITTSVLDDKGAYDIRAKLEKVDVGERGTRIDLKVIFGNEIEDLIASNKTPFDNVKQGTLELDAPNNALHYGDSSFVCNVSAKSLKELWKKEGGRGLLAMNLRYYVKNDNIDSKIEQSIMFQSDEFWYFNNGIIIVCDDYEIKGTTLVLRNFSIVNGGQTTNRIGNTPFDKDFFLCCKVVKNTFEDDEGKNRFVADVAEASNSQKPINEKDKIANRVEQRNLKSQLDKAGIFVEVKRGEKANKASYPEPWQKTKNNNIAQDLYSFIFMEPGPTRNSVSTLLKNDNKYSTIFKTHSYSNEFIKDLLFLEKAYDSYKKKMAKSDSIDGTLKGLIKNGFYYTLATIGYMAKFIYNPDFKESILKFRNDDNLFASYSAEQAFDHGFLAEQDFKRFCKVSHTIFDYIFTNLIRPAFDDQKEITPDLAYSNWTKSNTGFNTIRKRYINRSIFDLKNESDLDFLRSFFVQPTQKMIDLNKALYAKNIANNKVAKSANGYVLTKEDEDMRNELLVLRLKVSQEKNIGETRIFTEKQLDKVIINKPKTKQELAKIIKPETVYYIGDEMLKIIYKYI